MSLFCLFPNLPCPLVMELLTQHSGCCWREMGFSSHDQHSWGCQALTHCYPFLLRERLPPPYGSNSVQCSLVEVSGKVYFATTSTMIKSYIHMASQVALVVKNPLANAEDIIDMVLIPGSGRSHGKGYGNPLQGSCLENPMGR